MAQGVAVVTVSVSGVSRLPFLALIPSPSHLVVFHFPGNSPDAGSHDGVDTHPLTSHSPLQQAVPPYVRTSVPYHSTVRHSSHRHLIQHLPGRSILRVQQRSQPTVPTPRDMGPGLISLQLRQVFLQTSSLIRVMRVMTPSPAHVPRARAAPTVVPGSVRISEPARRRLSATSSHQVSPDYPRQRNVPRIWLSFFGCTDEAGTGTWRHMASIA